MTDEKLENPPEKSLDDLFFENMRVPFEQTKLAQLLGRHKTNCCCCCCCCDHGKNEQTENCFREFSVVQETLLLFGNYQYNAVFKWDSNASFVDVEVRAPLSTEWKILRDLVTPYPEWKDLAPTETRIFERVTAFPGVGCNTSIDFRGVCKDANGNRIGVSQTATLQINCPP